MSESEMLEYLVLRDIVKSSHLMRTKSEYDEIKILKRVGELRSKILTQYKLKNN